LEIDTIQLRIEKKLEEKRLKDLSIERAAFSHWSMLTIRRQNYLELKLLRVRHQKEFSSCCNHVLTEA
jgi:hypothetical protein